MFDRFGPYELHEQLGAGGMATVHRASIEIAHGVRREVALKRMLPEFASDKRFAEHLIREAKLASTLNHPNIVKIYELGRIEQTYFIAMELVYGLPLVVLMRRAHVAKVPAPIAVVLAILDELCDALDYASNGTDGYGEPLRIIHRDLSPGNLLVTDDGHVKLIDFGVAKAVAGSRFRTSSGLVKGKLGYMAIEAVDNEPLDQRADIFSAGVIAWEMLAARRLFKGKTEAEIVSKLRDAAIAPPSRYNAKCPPDLDAVVLRALARTVDDRWQSAAAMREALDAVRGPYRERSAPRDVVEWIASAPRRSSSGYEPQIYDEEPSELRLSTADLEDDDGDPPSSERPSRVRAPRVEMPAPPNTDSLEIHIHTDDAAPPELDRLEAPGDVAAGDVSKLIQAAVVPWRPSVDDTAKHAHLASVDDTSKQIRVMAIDDPSKQLHIEWVDDPSQQVTIDTADEATKRVRVTTTQPGLGVAPNHADEPTDERLIDVERRPDPDAPKKRGRRRR